ncbi:MAG: hypothetical protein IJY56_04755 [Clostridia bacterium]|nr:hypothetical protein [Clostridia bacterium]
MRSEKLQDAIGMVDAALVARAGKYSKNSRRLKWIIPVAAVLVLAIGIGGVFGSGWWRSPGSGVGTDGFVLARATYPVMAKYPFDDPKDTAAMRQWMDDRGVRRSYNGAGAGLTDFFKTTVSTMFEGMENENRIYSPLNLYMALALMAEISGGAARREILDLLGSESIEALRKQANAVWNANYYDDGTVTSILANALWLTSNDELSYKQETLDLLAQNYYASSFKGDFHDAEYLEAIKLWLNEQTRGNLENSVEELDLADATMVLASTLYFQAIWNESFRNGKTVKKAFHSPDGDVTCDFMCQTSDQMSYYWGEKFSAVSKELANSGSMYFILPDEGVALNELFSDAEALAMMVSSRSEIKRKTVMVDLELPKFDVSSDMEISSQLKKMGVLRSFSYTSDYTLLSEEAELRISEVNHSVRVAVDEDGVEATAFTAVEGETLGIPPSTRVNFVLDRPFVFVITGSDGLPLFVGTVNNP